MAKTIATAFRTPTTSVTARTVTITPEWAARLLALHSPNRKIKSTSNLAKIKRALVNGEWVENGEAIKVARDGNLLDGQHRLTAVVETGVPMRTLLIEGLEPATQDTMDTGSPRSLADVLAIRGEAQAMALAALSRKLYTAETFGLATACGHVAPPVTIKECVDYIDLNPWIRDVVQPSRKVGKAAFAPASLIGLLMVKFASIDEDDADYFFGRLADGVALSEGSPIHVLRRTLAGLGSTKTRQTSSKFVAAIIIKAWNKYRDGEDITLLKYRPGGASPESFPEPR